MDPQRRRSFVTVGLVVAMLLVALGSLSASAADPTIGHITGFVTRSDGVTAVSQVLVQAMVWNPTFEMWVEGDSAYTQATTGYYDVYITHAGPYRLKFDGRDVGYFPEFYDDVYSGDAEQGTPVTLDPVTHTFAANASIDRLNDVHGTVSDPAGALENATVTLYRLDPGSGNWVPAIKFDGYTPATATTAADGSYDIAELGSGTFRLGFTAAGHTPEFYPDIAGTDPTAVGIQDITLSREETTTAFDAVLHIPQPPVAASDSYVVAEDEVLNVVAPGVLENDTRGDFGPITALRVTNPEHGALSLFTEGSFTYTPNANYHGPDSFTYKATADGHDSAPATVSITVTSVNDAPVAADDSFVTPEDIPLVVSTAAGVLANDTDADGDTLTASKVTGPSHGTLVLSSDGSLTYTPDADYHGSDSFTYTASDGTLTDSATVTITVTSVNDAPVAVEDAYGTSEDTMLVIPAPGLLGNDTDADGDTLTSSKVTGPSHGTLSLSADGSLTYTPDADYHGPDSFTYRANDGAVDSAPATVTITVTSVNDAPVAADDSYATPEDIPLMVPAPGVLSNDADVDGDPLTAVVAAGPVHGTLELAPNGSLTYTPDADYHGPDSFTYTASDGTLSDTATVSITVTSVNDPPIAADDSYATPEDVPLVVSTAAGVLANDTDADGDALSASRLAGPSHGTLSLSADGSLTYTPAANYHGPDSFTYSVSDGVLADQATVLITVTSVNDAPVAHDDSTTTAEDTPADISVIANDTDVDGDTLHVAALGISAHGTASVNPDGTVHYSPATDYHGLDSFTYTVSDGTLTDSATVTITVTSVNDAPVAADDSYETPEDTPLIVSSPGVLQNDADVDGDTLTASKVAGPSHGTLVLSSDGSLTYTPAANYHGPDSFTYSASDGNLTDTATVTITVTSVNDPPVASPDAYTAVENIPLIVSAAAGVLQNDADVDGDELIAVVLAPPAHGMLALAPNGSFIYTPNTGYTGPDAFTYVANDGTSDSSPATAAITVRLVNHPPAAVDDAYSTPEDTALVVSAPGVLANDTDADGDTLSVSKLAGPSHGTLSLSSNGSLNYTPAADYHGPDSFTYTVSDGTLTDTASVSITVTSVNDPPVAVDDGVYSIAEDTALTVTAPGVLSNDHDVEGDKLTAVEVTGPAHGTLALSDDGSFTYTPTADYNGPDSFAYAANDGAAYSSSARVAIVVTAVNDAPVADSVSVTAQMRAVLELSVIDHAVDVDEDTLLATHVTAPTHGTASIENGGEVIRYVPDTDFYGIDTFAYSVSDGSLTDTASVTVTVLPPAGQGSAEVATGTSSNATVSVALPDGTLGTVTVLFGDVSSAGTLYVRRTAAPAGPADGSFLFAGQYWDFTFTGSFDTAGGARITLPYDPRLPDTRANGMMVKRWDGSAWLATPVINVDLADHKITITTPQLSAFALAESLTVNTSAEISVPAEYTPAYDTAATIVARVLDSADEPLAHKVVKVTYSRDMVTWSVATTMSPVAGEAGSYAAEVKPLYNGLVHVRVSLEADGFNSSASAVLLVRPKVYLTRPRVSASGTRLTTITGYVKPGHSADVTLEMYRRVSSTEWAVTRITRKTTSAGRFDARVALAPGTWKLRLVAAEDVWHATTQGPFRTCHVGP